MSLVVSLECGNGSTFSRSPDPGLPVLPPEVLTGALPKLPNRMLSRVLRSRVATVHYEVLANTQINVSVIVKSATFHGCDYSCNAVEYIHTRTGHTTYTLNAWMAILVKKPVECPSPAVCNYAMRSETQTTYNHNKKYREQYIYLNTFT